VLLAALVSGTSTFVNFWAVQGVNSDAFIGARNALVAAMLVPVALLVAPGELRRLGRADAARLALIGLVGGAVPFLLFFRGLQLASAEGGAATATFAYRALFLFAAGFAFVALGERPTRRFAAAAALIVAGNLGLLSIGAPVWTQGSWLVLAATVLWAGEYALSKRALARLSAPTVALGRMGFGVLFLLPYLALTGGVQAWGAMTAGQWTWMLLSAALLLAFLATWYAGLARVDLSTAAGLLALAFPITFALGAAAGKAPLALGPALGAAAVVFAGVALASAGAVKGPLRLRLEQALRALARGTRTRG
jgi:drug/metabolite transporter (DMT)-like permease